MPVPVAIASPAATRRVGDLEIAGQRKFDAVDVRARLDFGDLAESFVLDAVELQELPLAADGQHLEPGLRRD